MHYGVSFIAQYCTWRKIKPLLFLGLCDDYSSLCVWLLPLLAICVLDMVSCVFSNIHIVLIDKVGFYSQIFLYIQDVYSWYFKLQKKATLFHNIIALDTKDLLLRQDEVGRCIYGVGLTFLNEAMQPLLVLER